MIKYDKTKWVDGTTVLRASHMEKIEKGITDIIDYNNSIYTDEDTRKSNEKQRQEEHLRKMNEVSEVVSDIQKDYDSLQKIIIDENANANLQNQINLVNSQLEQKANKGDSISVAQINKNTGKFDETYMTDEFLQQMAGNTPIHSIPADNSITNDKLSSLCVGLHNIDEGLVNGKDCYDVSIVLSNSGLRLITDNIPSAGIWTVEYTVYCNTDNLVSANIFFGGYKTIKTSYIPNTFMKIKHSSNGVNITDLALLFDVKNSTRFNFIVSDINVYLDGQKQNITIDKFSTSVNFTKKEFEYSLALKKDISNIHKELSLVNSEIDKKAIAYDNSNKFQFFYNKSDAGLDFLKFQAELLEDVSFTIGDTIELAFDIDVLDSNNIVFINSIASHMQNFTKTTVSETALSDTRKRVSIIFTFNGEMTINKGLFHMSPKGYVNYLKNGCIINNVICLVKGNIVKVPYFSPYTPSNYPDMQLLTIPILDEECINYKVLKDILGIKEIKWVAFGDSLTEENTRTTKNYHSYVAEELKYNVINMGKGGTGYKRTDASNTAFYQRVDSIPLDTDIVTFFGSGNDLTLTLGSVTDTTLDSVCGCIHETFKRLFERLPGVRVGVVLPCPWGNYPPSEKGNKMELYSDALKEIAEMYSIPVLDLYHGSNLRPWDETFRSLYYKRDDGNSVHPDEDGHKLLANKFKMFIQSL